MTKEFPGDFENFTKSKEYKNAKKAQKDKYEKDKQHPVKGKHAGFDRLVNSGKKEAEAFKTYRKNRADTQDKARVNAKKGGSIKKKKQGYKDRKDESIAMRIRKKRTKKQLKDSRDESYGKFGSKAKKSGKINR